MPWGYQHQRYGSCLSLGLGMYSSVYAGLTQTLTQVSTEFTVLKLISQMEAETQARYAAEKTVARLLKKFNELEVSVKIRAGVWLDYA